MPLVNQTIKKYPEDVKQIELIEGKIHGTDKSQNQSEEEIALFSLIKKSDVKQTLAQRWHDSA